MKLKENITNRYGIDNKHIEKFRNKILTIQNAFDNNSPNYNIEEDEYKLFWFEDMLEPAETNAETLGQQIDNLMENIKDLFVNNPKAAIMKLGKIGQEKDEKIEELETELKNKQSRIDYLEGQISVFKEFLKED